MPTKTRKKVDRKKRPVGAAAVPEDTAVQSGDLQGLPESPQADSQSVAELLEEGNSFEAAIVQGVEDAPNADASEVKTHESPEDDVPPEYTQPDRP